MTDMYSKPGYTPRAEVWDQVQIPTGFVAVTALAPDESGSTIIGRRKELITIANEIWAASDKDFKLLGAGVKMLLQESNRSEEDSRLLGLSTFTLIHYHYDKKIRRTLRKALRDNLQKYKAARMLLHISGYDQNDPVTTFVSPPPAPPPEPRH